MHLNEHNQNISEWLLIIDHLGWQHAKNLFFQVPEEIFKYRFTLLLFLCFSNDAIHCFEYLVKQINNRCSFQSVQDDQSSYISFTSTDSSGCLQLISLSFFF